MSASPAFSIAAVPRAARAALQWRLLLLWALWMLVPTLIMALPAWHLLSSNLDYSVHAAALARALDMTAVSDLLDVYGRHQAVFTQAGSIALGVTLLISPLLSGMVATAARAPQPPGFAALTRGGLAYYAPMLRMLAWGAVPLGAAFMAGISAVDAASTYAGKVVTTGETALPMMLAQALMVLLIGLVTASLDAGRAILANDVRQRSALAAWWSGCMLLARHPVAALGTYIVISLVGLGLAGLLSLLRVNTAGVGVLGFTGALLLTQAAVVTIGWMRSARLFALIDLVRARAS
ncbi:hypothetical protein RBA41_18565 [Massilia sp. CCM 9210]|uniref:hypothetical protein n=1 Tax=Massilia scottii TaxID=3057166 RepID=UPI0027964882|nr:hypothetical protein [Massilia sp. CCM 9210]MDQ1815307.1 hypothetical protein [Massilia sp. CCM 9210]